MPRPPAVDPRIDTHFRIPASLRGWLELHLHSDLEGRVPHGGLSELIVELIRRERDHTKLDLGLYGFPAGYWVSGEPEMIEALRRRLT